MSDSVLQAVKFKRPGDAGYTDITGAVVGKVIGGVSNLPANVQTYSAFEDVTSLVQATGAGTYTMANVRGDPGNINHFAGWSLVVAYEAPTEVARNLTVFNGFAAVSNNSAADRNVTVPFTGFIAPPSGDVNATIGFVTYEGDLGITGDSAYLEGGQGETQLSNATNPANNFFNSSITNRGTTVTTKTPNYVNQLGFDADLVATTNIIANGATSANVRLTSTQDQYYPGVITTTIELYAPKVTVEKSVTDLNGGEVIAGDQLRYTVTVSNAANALDAAASVILHDVIPANTTYKPGTLVITAGANPGPKTDASGDDQAEFDSIGNQVQFQLGTGATAFQGGMLIAGATTTVSFDVTVNPDVVVETLIRNKAVSTFVAETSRFLLEAKSNIVDVICKPSADLSIVKTDGSATYVPGQNLTYTITVANAGPSTVTGATVSDLLPTNTTFVSATNGATYNAGTNTVSFVSGTLAPSGTTSFELTVKPAADRTGDLVNTAVVSPPSGVVDPNLSNNTSTDTNSCKPTVNLAITKTDGSLIYVPGTSTTYTIIATNSGPSFLLNGKVVDALPPQVSTASWTATYSGAGSTGPASGTGALNETISLAAGGTATFLFTVNIKSDATGDMTNTVTVAPPQGTTGNTATATDTNTVQPTVNLSVTKDDGSLIYVPGTSTTYTIIATNSGPSFLANGKVVDALPPQVSTATWTATYSGAGSTGPASGTGALNETISLAVGGTATFLFTVNIKSDATGSMTNTVTVSPPQGTVGNTATATDTNTVQPTVNLAITKTDGTDTYKSGGTTTYTIVLTNKGPSDATGVTVVDVLPPEIDITTTTWFTVYANANGNLPTVPTKGNISGLVNLLAGTGMITITINANIVTTPPPPQTKFGDMINTVTATPAEGIGQPVSATDINAYDGPINPQVDIRALVTGSDDGCNGLPWVHVLDPETGTPIFQFLAYEKSFHGSVRVATGDVTGDGIPEIIVGPGRNRVGQIRVFTPTPIGSTNYTELVGYRTLPFGPSYRGGVEVSVGDVNGDGLGDIVAGQSSGAGLTRAFLVSPNAVDPVANTPYRSFRAFPGPYTGGVMVAAGDFGTYANGVKTSNSPDGIAEIAVGSNAGMKTTVKVYEVSGAPAVVRTILPFGQAFRGGTTLSVAKYTSDAVDDLFAGTGIGGNSVVQIYDGTTLANPVKLSAFASFAKPNARVFTAALDSVLNPGVVQTIYGVKGLSGGGGAKGVSAINRNTPQTNTTLSNSTFLAPPLRIAPIIVRLAG